MLWLSLVIVLKLMGNRFGSCASDDQVKQRKSAAKGVRDLCTGKDAIVF